MSDLSFFQVEVPELEPGGPMRLWALRGPAGAVSVVARLLRGDDRAPEGMTVEAPDGVRLLPTILAIHRRPRPGEVDVQDPCHALDGPCVAAGHSFLAADRVLNEWAASGHDDGVIRSELEGWYESYLPRSN
ncbi:hypothetical protein [Micromonospora sp. NPDC047730]|uniref:hypothetical protein n=1 Tax=Micromonospora sp. NPDC047730 TaxID=3364253 RepID=UPI00371F3A69